MIKKLADIEKEIEAVAQKPEAETPREEVIKNEAPKALVIVIPTPKARHAGGLSALMGGLARKGVMLSPDLVNIVEQGGILAALRRQGQADS